jgi:hypothetical protein
MEVTVQHIAKKRMILMATIFVIEKLVLKSAIQIGLELTVKYIAKGKMILQDTSHVTSQLE